MLQVEAMLITVLSEKGYKKCVKFLLETHQFDVNIQTEVVFDY